MPVIYALCAGLDGPLGRKLPGVVSEKLAVKLLRPAAIPGMPVPPVKVATPFVTVKVNGVLVVVSISVTEPSFIGAELVVFVIVTVPEQESTPPEALPQLFNTRAMLVASGAMM
jgi:hypothetical protein